MTEYTIELVHSQDLSKNHKFNCQENNKSKYCFYRIDQLEEDGFIHPDRSLRLRLYIKKDNFRKRVEKLEIKSNALEKSNREYVKKLQFMKDLIKDITRS